jgi:glycosyltransferase involved in cell wall biosynthesis
VYSFMDLYLLSVRGCSMSLKILVIGAVPPPVGGTTVLLQQLLNHLERDEQLSVRLLNTSPGEGTPSIWRRAIRVVRLGFSAVYQIKRADVVTMHASDRGIIYGGWVIGIISKLLNKPYVLRCFGGSLSASYYRLGIFRKWLVRMTFRLADLCLVETKHLVNFCNNLTRDGKVRWYPNNRPLRVRRQRISNRVTRFAFISRVCREKGIVEVVSAAAKLDNISVDVYGEIHGSIDASLFQVPNVQYKGPVHPSDVSKVLSDYDVLLLPTYWEGEGYPGIVLEAFSLGIPVITTNWSSIPEIVDASCGILVEPRNVVQLIDAIRHIQDPERYARLSRGATARMEGFRSDFWADEFVRLCTSLVAGRRDQ